MQRATILQPVPNLAFVVLRWWYSTEVQRKTCSFYVFNKISRVFHDASAFQLVCVFGLTLVSQGNEGYTIIKDILRVVGNVEEGWMLWWFSDGGKKLEAW